MGNCVGWWSAMRGHSIDSQRLAKLIASVQARSVGLCVRECRLQAQMSTETKNEYDCASAWNCYHCSVSSAGTGAKKKRLLSYRGDAQEATRDERGQLQSVDERLSVREYWWRITLSFLMILVLGVLAAAIAVAMHNHMFGN
jgi:hypothetical protein